MNRFFRSFITAAVALVAMAMIAPNEASAQSAGIPTATAEAFLGQWTAALDAQGQAVSIDMNIIDRDGQLAVVVSNPLGGDVEIENMVKDGEKLVLSYAADAQGQLIPIVVTLTPESDTLNADINIADGMFMTSAKAVRKRVE